MPQKLLGVIPTKPVPAGFKQGAGIQKGRNLDWNKDYTQVDVGNKGYYRGGIPYEEFKEA